MHTFVQRTIVTLALGLGSCASVDATIDHAIRLDRSTAAQAIRHAHALGEARDFEVFPEIPSVDGVVYVFAAGDRSASTIMLAAGEWLVIYDTWINHIPSADERAQIAELHRLIYRRLRTLYPQLPPGTELQEFYWERSEATPEPPPRPWESGVPD